MELNRKNLKGLMLLIAFALLLSWGINNPGQVLNMFSWVVNLCSPFLVGFCLAFVLNIIMRPLEKLWDRLFKNKKGAWKHKLRRGVCMVLSVILLFGVISIMFFVLVPQLRSTFESIAQMVPQSVQKLEQWWGEIYLFLDSHGLYAPALDLDADKLIDKVTNLASQWGSALVNKTVNFTVSVFKLLFNFIMALIVALYVLSQKEHHGDNCRSFIRAIMKPQRADTCLRVSSLVNRSFTNYVTGQVTEAIILGCLCFAGMLIFGFPYAPVISVVIGFSALIPIFGAWIGAVVGAFLIVFVSPIKALWFLIFLIILQQLEGNIIYPKVVGKSVGLPGIWVLAAVTIGGGAFGLLGMIMGVPVCAVVYTLMKEFVQSRNAELDQDIKSI